MRCFNLLYAAVVFWPKFYWHMFGPSSEGRSILSILSHPLGDDFPSQAARERFEDDQQLSNCHVSLKPTHARLYVHTALQFNGAASHLASPLNKQVKDGLTAAMDSAAVIPYFDDRLSMCTSKAVSSSVAPRMSI